MSYNHFRYARRVDGDNIGLYHGSTKILNIDKGTANTIIIEGLEATGKLLVLKANETQDNPRLFLDGNSGNINATIEDTSDYFGIKVGAVNNIRLFGTGAIHFKETTTPSAITDFGAIYTKNDNELYFQDGAGNEKTVTTV